MDSGVDSKWRPERFPYSGAYMTANLEPQNELYKVQERQICSLNIGTYPFRWMLLFQGYALCGT